MRSLSDIGDRKNLLARLHQLSADTPRRWGRMTADQMICHLNDAFLGCLGEKKVSAASGLFQRTVMKWGALQLPIPWPKGVPTRPEMEQGKGGTPPREFGKDREALVGTMERFPQEKLTGCTHPIFGKMTYAEWMRWGYLHVDHHLRQFGL